MRYALSLEQDALARETTKFLTAALPTERDAVLRGEVGFDGERWSKACAEVGLASIGIAERHGGAGGSLLDIAVTLEASGRTLTSLPVWAAAVGMILLDDLAEGEHGRDLLERLGTGDLIPSWVGLHHASALSAEEDGGGWRISGTVRHVVNCGATSVIAFAGTTEGPRAFEAELDQAGITVHHERAVDPTRPLSTLVFNRAVMRPLHPAPLAAARLAALRARVDIVQAAEQVGVAAAALDMAVEYAKTRTQFGRRIGAFQSIKHLLADMYVDVEVARDTARYAAWAADDPQQDIVQLGHITRAFVNPRVSRVCAGNLQILGGIGYTWEHPSHLYYKRALTSERLATDTSSHLDAIATRIGIAPSSDGRT